MPGPTRLLLACTLTLLLNQSAASRQNDAPAQGASAAVTASAAAGRVRFTAPPETARLRLEVYDEGGQLLAEVSAEGSVLDWAGAGAGGAPLADGEYRLVLTATAFDGSRTRRHGALGVSGGALTLRGETGGAARRPASTGGPAEQEPLPLSILVDAGGGAVTSVGHDGAAGLLVRGRGALSFRLGDFFSGADREQMRLTEDGRLGIGTDSPEATLDVAGAVKASGGFKFADGTTLTSEGGRLKLTGAQGETLTAPGASLAGTPNRLAKFDGSGNVSDSALTESGGLLGVGTSSPTTPVDVVYNNNAYGFGLNVKNTNTGPQALTGFGIDNAAGVRRGQFIFASPTYEAPSIRDSIIFSSVGPTTQLGFMSSADGTGTPDIYFRAGAAKANNVYIKGSTGNVGIGTDSPAAKLDVAGAVNASTQYNIGGLRVLSVSGEFKENTFAGVEAGASNTTGTTNSFFGYGTGFSNTAGGSNAFFGVNAGRLNTSGSSNSFFGNGAGYYNKEGVGNSIFGRLAAGGNYTTPGTGSANSIFGHMAGFYNSAGYGNSIFGSESGFFNDTGEENAFFGRRAGFSNKTGNYNTAVGAQADIGTTSTTLSNATAIGARALVTQSNSLVLGSINGTNTATADTKVGIGTTAPLARLDVRGDIYAGLTAAPSVPFGQANALYLANDGGNQGHSFRVDGSADNLYIVARSLGLTSGAGIVFRTGPLSGGEADSVRLMPSGQVRLFVLGTPGSTHLCLNASSEIAACAAAASAPESADAGQPAERDRTIDELRRQNARLEARLAEQEARLRALEEALKAAPDRR